MLNEAITITGSMVSVEIFLLLQTVTKMLCKKCSIGSLLQHPRTTVQNKSYARNPDRYSAIKMLNIAEMTRFSVHITHHLMVVNDLKPFITK